ncbi:hypothetical protein CFE70_006952 [Pyrenophora teres f. teres 0-1]
MAVHDDYPGITVQVIADGQPLKEYEPKDKEEPPKAITRYVESISGVEFAINTTFTPPFDELFVSLALKIDGAFMSGRTVPAKNLNKEIVYIQSYTCWKEEGKWWKSSFRFSNLDIVEDSHNAISSEQPKPTESVGTIEVSVYRVTNVNSSPNIRAPKKELRQIGPISEEVLKGDTRSLQTILGPVEEHKVRKNRLRSRREPEPLVTFRFKYRSIGKAVNSSLECYVDIIDALKSLGFISDSSSTTPNTALGQTSEETQIPTSTTRHYHSTCATTRNSQKKTSTSIDQHEQDGVTVDEIIAMIAGYRGHDKGLAGQKRKSLLALLKYYENQDTENTTERHQSIVSGSGNVANKQEPTVIDNDYTHVKREAEEPGTVHGNEKRRKIEVIVIDD